MSQRGLIFFFISLAFTVAGASQQGIREYYGHEFQAQYQSGALQGPELVKSLHRILAHAHVKNPGSPDTIVPSCEISGASKTKCEQHQSVGYDNARSSIFGMLFLEEIGGVYAFKDVYCEKTYTDSDFGQKEAVGPGKTPPNALLVNTEHTWPQSRFTGKFPKDMQKSDLHHLFPTDSKMNSMRSSFRFGEVHFELEQLPCSQGKLGHPSETTEIVFEPPTNHRGNVARAIFYFAIRYQMKISPREEETLRRWHQQDPVDQDEISRNDMIQSIQGNRNPLIDHPEMLAKMPAFK